jgi:predicted extracellular nuclease
MGTVAEYTDVLVQGVSVTGSGNNGITVQHATGGAYSGIYIFLGLAPTGSWSDVYALGDIVDVEGEYNEYYEVSQIDATGGTVTWLSTGAPLTAETFSDAAALGMTAEAYEGVLVQIMDVTVGSEPSTYGEWDIGGDIYVDDTFHAYSSVATVTIGDTFDSVTGALHFSFSEWKLLPRNDADFTGYTDN